MKESPGALPLGTWFSSWYVSIDAGRRAQSPQSGPGWSPALKMESVLFPPSAAPAQRCLCPSWGRKCQRQARPRLSSRSRRWETQPRDRLCRALCWTGRAPGGLRWAGWGVPRSLLGTGPVAVSSGFRAKPHRGSSDLSPDAGRPAQSRRAGLPPPEASWVRTAQLPLLGHPAARSVPLHPNLPQRMPVSSG